ncbi:hypothetical protein CG716_22805 [Mycolicibacterium sphagni]|uniref:Uncharacterized protein n=1 Tax=Mycolicibacterium sphagni TaxID=1786 RepID=A0A255DGU8_9MYCO|nr:hypothetical protein CG716_22805 [Mycolicibacterium sphagni]
MIVTVSGKAPAVVSLRDPQTFTEFHIVAVGDRNAEALSAALESADVGFASGPDQAYITAAAVIRLVGPASETPDWQRQFDQMVEYATTRGWYDTASGAIAAHVEWRARDSELPNEFESQN